MTSSGLGYKEYAKLVKELPYWNAVILKAIMELTLAMWQNEECTKMDPGKVAVCIGPNLMKRSAAVGFSDLSGLFFEMSSHVEEIFGVFSFFFF